MSETGDGLDHLRIPYEKIKFGEKLEVQGYGTVFEGEFDDQRVALKQLNITNLANIKPKLLDEILTISRFRQHPNLVALLGFCDEKSNEIILVYEYVASGNLADKMRKRLTTIQRFEICLGAARGLDYLHTGADSTTPGIVHGNVKLSKILLNSAADSSKFEAKVSSFGLSKIVPGKAQKTLESSHEATVTKESDVYSFGVLLLEVLCGVSELVDTDDYQERHVTELVPKKMEQNKLRKIVHFDIRKEIKTESLETYAKIACQCVMENPDARPKMAQVVEELEKALKLQGGEVTYVHIPGSRNIAGAKDGTAVKESSRDEGSGGTLESNIGNEPKEVNIPTVEEGVQDLSGGDKLDDIKEDDGNEWDAGEDNGKDGSAGCTISESDTGEKNILEDTNTGSVLNNNHIEDATTSESSNGGTSTLTYKEVQDSGILLKSEERNSHEVIDDELEHLRIPYYKVKFGQRIDVRGYGTMFVGEFNNQQVALKRLNITNLGNIKPKLLSAILSISRFQQHPNLVALIGFCEENNKEIVLVYEYISGGNLADKMSKHLTTIQRLEICLGAARGLEYLHHGVDFVDCIIHGDLKLSKILLNLDSVSSKFEAKVSGFGLPKLLPGHVQINPKSIDPMHVATGKLTKESDVYTFGVLLLEVLCGVLELVDTDDYREKHVTELVPKRLEQNMLRKIVHFDIRDEITTESLETYARIACRCVMKNPEERPTMTEVVEELNKALKLQGGKVHDVQIFGSSNGDNLTEVLHHEGDDNGEKMSTNTTEEEIKLGQSIPVPVLVSDDVESVSEDTDVEKADNMNNLESTEEITVDLKSNEESKKIEEHEDNGDYSSSTLTRKVSDVQLIVSDGNGPPEVSVGEDEKDGDGNGEPVSTNITEEEPKVIEETADAITLEGGEKKNDNKMNAPESAEEVTVLKSNEESKNEVNKESKITRSTSKPDNGDGSNSVVQERGFPIPDERSDYKDGAAKEKGNVLTMNTQNPHMKEFMEEQNGGVKGGSLNTEKSELIVVDIRGDFSNQIQESESKRSNGTSSESSNGDESTPSDHLLPKDPLVNMTKTSKNSRNCCTCSWWRFISGRVVFYGGQFWNKLVSCFTWITGRCSSKKD